MVWPWVSAREFRARDQLHSAWSPAANFVLEVEHNISSSVATWKKEGEKGGGGEDTRLIR